MSFDEKTLYELLPAIYRIRDAERGGPLAALLEVISEQARVLEENLAQLYDDQFVETCAPWALPYIGDLIGITGLPGTNLQALSPRAEVAHTINYRRAKGTAAVLEQLARDVTGWPARAVEFFQLLATTQYMNHPRPENQSFVSVRGAERLEYLGGAFEHGAGVADLTHTVEVRRIASGRGRYNIPNVGIFLWRLRPFSLTRSQAVAAAAGDAQRFFFSPLGIDLPLFNLPATEDEAAHLAEPVNVPDRITRRVLARSLSDYYGRGKSLLVEVYDPAVGGKLKPVDPEQIAVCDLTDWVNLPTGPKDKVALDPVLGRVAFPPVTDPPNVNTLPAHAEVLVTFHYGFSASMGGGEYNRLSSFDTRQTEVLDEQGRPILKRVANTYFGDAAAQGVDFVSVGAALAALGPRGGTVEVVDSGRYEERLTIDAAGRLVELRAADKRRPTIVLDRELQIINGGPEDEVILDGLLIVGGGLRVTGNLGRLRLRHCTLVPGISLSADGAPKQPGTPSLFINSANTQVEIDRCIVGGVRAGADVEFSITSSIVDALAEENFAYASTDAAESAPGFGGPLRVENSTVIGMVRASVMRLASNTIFLAAPKSEADRKALVAPVLAERRQEGCARFSYLSPGARVPSRYRCQPGKDDSLVRPRLTSTRFRDPAYCQLSANAPAEIRQGADDEAEMGAFHDLFEPQREAHLRARLEEYLRFGLEAGVFYAT